MQVAKPNFDQLRTHPGEATSEQETQPQILLLGAGFGTGNRGVGALACGTISAITKSFPEARIYLLDYGKEPQRQQIDCQDERPVSVELVNLRFSKNCFLRNNVARLLITALGFKLIPFRLRKRLIVKNPYLELIYNGKFAASIAGGDSFSDIYGLTRLIYISFPQLLVLALGKPLILLPQTIGPFNTAVGRTIARFILRRAKYIYTRDKHSLGEVTRVLGHKQDNVAHAYDMGFALEPLAPPVDVQLELQRAKRKSVMIGLNVSGLLYRGGYTGRNQFDLRMDYRDLIRRLIGVLMHESNVHVVLVPHVFGESATSEGDNVACEELLQQFDSKHNGRLTTVRARLDQHEIKWVVSQCDFFIGSRMHACIAALSQYIPTVGLAYSRKFAGVFDMIGGGARVIDLREANTGEVLNAVTRAFNEREILRGELRARMPAIKESVLNLFVNIKTQRVSSSFSSFRNGSD